MTFQELIHQTLTNLTIRVLVLTAAKTVMRYSTLNSKPTERQAVPVI